MDFVQHQPLVKKFCSSCNTKAAVVICDGCQQSFCGRHVVDHRQHLTGQLDELIEKTDLVQVEFQQQPEQQDLLVKQVDQWEREAISDIQLAAHTARRNLELIRKESSELLKTSFEKISSTLRTSREADDFSENDLNQWSTHLQQMKTEMITPSAAKIVYNQHSVIQLLTITTEVATPPEDPPISVPASPPSSALVPTLIAVPSPRSRDIHYDSRERFLELLGPGTISEQGLLATHTGTSKEYVYFRGHLLYSENCFGIRFRIEKFQKPYEIFLGYTSIRSTIEEVPFESESTIGWAGFNQIFINGRYDSNAKRHRYYSGKIQRKDVMRLSFDCEKRQIRLMNERTKTTNVLHVQKHLFPAFWQVLVVLSCPGDSVRVLTHM